MRWETNFPFVDTPNVTQFALFEPEAEYELHVYKVPYVLNKATAGFV